MLFEMVNFLPYTRCVIVRQLLAGASLRVNVGTFHPPRDLAFPLVFEPQNLRNRYAKTCRLVAFHTSAVGASRQGQKTKKRTKIIITYK